MARTTIRTEDITASEVTTAKVADNAVTLPKLEDGTQGDILYYGASGAPARLGFGTSGDFLKTQGTGANPIWAAAAGGKIGQVLVVEDATAQTLATATYTATGLSQVITPSASSSKILCVWTMMALLAGGGSGQGFSVQINRSISGGAATDIYTSSGSYDVYTDQSGCHGKGVWMHLDSPSTTSATTYLVEVSSMSGYSITLNTNDNQTQLLLMEVLA